ncbi:MAG: hypothetical protein LUG99_21050 [Lachnospiraceae bacterium]|nr:hypothetical protein [Lachnospiraceae bacterium]
MSELDRLYHLMCDEMTRAKITLSQIEKELEGYDSHSRAIVIKKIKGRPYYYMQWKEDGKLCCRYLGAVKPGAVFEEEGKIRRYQELTAEIKEQVSLIEQIDVFLRHLRSERRKKHILEDYSFEVFWKDEITSRVIVKGSRVQVTRFVEHPLKQLFAYKDMTRDQLNRIFEMRCFDRNRADIAEILMRLGLDEYNPYEIVKKTHGVSYNDYIWFRFPGERLTSQDVLVRG